MRIAHIHWSLGTGGIETMLPDIVSEQAKDNEVALFIINDRVEDFILAKIDKRVKLYLLNRREGSKNPLSIIKLNLLLAKFRPDVIHTHAYREINLVLYPFGKRVRTIHNTHNVCSEYPRYDKLISISKAVQVYTNNQGFESVVADNGIPTKRIRCEHKDVFKDGKLHFVQVSRLDVEQKGQDILIRALHEVVNSHHIKDIVMHFIGKGGDEQMLKELVKELGLTGIVIFEGLKDQQWIYEHLCDYDLFIQPSRYEGFGLTVAEAVAAKVPVLVSDIEGPLEIIDGGRYGEHFRVGDSDDCAKQIVAFVLKGRNDKQVEEAYKYVIDHYDVSITANKYIEVYNSFFGIK